MFILSFLSLHFPGSIAILQDLSRSIFTVFPSIRKQYELEIFKIKLGSFEETLTENNRILILKGITKNLKRKKLRHNQKWTYIQENLRSTTKVQDSFVEQKA